MLFFVDLFKFVDAKCDKQSEHPRTMAKVKSKANESTVPQKHKHLHARLTFLHQAALYLLAGKEPEITDHEASTTTNQHSQQHQQTTQLAESTRLLTQVRGVSRKAQIRLEPQVKHSICKRCDMLLIQDQTSTQVTVNASKGGKKPWADVLEIRCNTCRTVKRFPVGMAKKPKVKERRSKKSKP
jgi:ribonuclease P protein subunit RPR2